MKLSLTEDYLSKVLESAYSNTICEWQAQGISDKEIIDKINQKTDGSIDMLLEQASKDYHNYFLEKSFATVYKGNIIKFNNGLPILRRDTAQTRLWAVFL